MEISNFRDFSLEDECLRLKPYKTIVLKNLSNEELKSIKGRLITQKADFEFLVNNFYKLNDKEFFKCYKDFYQWNSDEILIKLNKNIKNKQIKTIKTNDVIKVLKSSKNKNLEYEWRGLAYKVASDESLKLDKNFYSKQEIADLLERGEIVILKKDIPFGNVVYTPDAILINSENSKIQLHYPKINSIFNQYYKNILDEDIDNCYEKSREIFKMIRQEFNSDILKKDYMNYCEQQKKILNEISREMAIRKTNEHIDSQEEINYN